MRTIKIKADTYRQDYNYRECKQNDDIPLEVTLLEGGVELDLSGYTITLNWIKSDNTVVTIAGDTIKVIGNIVSLILPRDCTRAVGQAKFELVITDNTSKQISTFPLSLEIIGSVIQGQQASNNVATLTEELNNANIAAINTKNELKDVIDTADLTTYASQGQMQEVNLQLADNENYINQTKDTISIIPKIIGHRGLMQYVPENTLSAIEVSKQYGIDGCECDIRPTLDGEYVIMHDLSVDRTTDGVGNVADLTLSQIKSFIVDTGNNIEYYPNLKIPTLEEQVQYCKINNMILVAHASVKLDIPKLITILDKYDMQKHTVIISNDINNCVLLREYKKITVFYITMNGLTNEMIEYASSYGVNLSYNSEIMTIDSNYETLIKYAHLKNIKLNAWTENNIDRVQKLYELGVEYITTDRETLKNYKNKKQTNITIVTEQDFLNYMSPILKNKQPNIPTTDGYFMDGNTIHFYSSDGQQGFAYSDDIGKFNKGDIVEISFDVEVKEGNFQVYYNTDVKLANDVFVYPIGKYKITRRFVLPYDCTSLTPIIGTKSNSIGSFAIIGGINFNVISNINRAELKDKLAVMIKTNDSTDTNTKLEFFIGDSCIINKESFYLYKITFKDTLKRRGIAMVSGDVGMEMYDVKTGYSTTNSVMIQFVNTTTGEKVNPQLLPSGMYINIALL